MKKKKPNHRDSFYDGCLNFFTNEEIIYMMGVLILNPRVILGIYIEKLVLCDKIEQCYFLFFNFLMGIEQCY